jgi:hypothetical protein
MTTKDLRAVVFFRNNAEALVAQGLISRAGLGSEIIPSPHGCGYAIRLPVRELEQAVRLMLAQRIPVSRVELA